jgi:hypothetical protein
MQSWKKRLLWKENIKENWPLQIKLLVVIYFFSVKIINLVASA